MTFDETTVLLGFINSLDKRVAFDETSISAWCNVLGPYIGLEQAMEYVREHYRETDRAVLPSHIVGKHRMNTTPVRKVISSNHECLNGYVLVEETRSDGMIYEAVAKCPQCTKL